MIYPVQAAAASTSCRWLAQNRAKEFRNAHAGAAPAGGSQAAAGGALAVLWPAALRLLVAALRLTADRRRRGFTGAVLQVVAVAVPAVLIKGRVMVQSHKKTSCFECLSDASSTPATPQTGIGSLDIGDMGFVCVAGRRRSWRSCCGVSQPRAAAARQASQKQQAPLPLPRGSCCWRLPC